MSVSDATLGLQLSGATAARQWGLADELPAVARWRPVRMPRSNAHGRHVPVRAYSITMDAHLSVESGLEHDLVRVLDRDPCVDLILPQPCRFRFGNQTEHVPDLLSRDSKGALTLWDVRTPRRMDEAFHSFADRTRDLCRALGWGYELFSGLDDVARMNLLWLNGYRHARPLDRGRGTPAAPGCYSRSPASERPALSRRWGRTPHRHPLAPAVERGARGRSRRAPGRLRSDLHAAMTDPTRWTTSLRIGTRILMVRGFAVVLELRRDGVVVRPSGEEPELVLGAQLGQASAVSGDAVAAIHRAMRPEWDRLSPEARQDALDRLEIVQEIITGFRDGHPELARPGEPFTPYGPGYGLSESRRAEEMARDLSEQKNADRALLRRRLERGQTGPPTVAVSTVRAWLTRWRKGGLLDLVDRRKDRSDEWLARLPVEFHQAAEAEVARLDGDISAVHIGEVHRRTLVRLQAQGYSDGMPSAKVARRLYSQLLAGRGRTTRSHRAYAVRRASSTRSFPALRPGQVVAVDVTRADNLVWDSVGAHPLSVEIFTALDVCTRTVLATRVVPMSADSIDLGLLLYDVMRPFSQVVKGTEISDWRWAGVPESLDLPPESVRTTRRRVSSGSELQGEHWVPAVMPEGLRCDKGSIMMSAATRSLLHYFGIDHLPSRGKKPTDNAHLERWHDTLQRCLQQIPGYKGHNPTERGRLVSSEPLLTADELQRHLRRWIALDYHRTQHTGLVLAGAPDARLTPLEYFDAMLEVTGRIDVPQRADLLYDFLPVSWATIGRAGVEIKGLAYDSHELKPYRDPVPGRFREKDAAAAFFVDPHDLTRIWFRCPVNDNVLEIPWRGSHLIDAPLTDMVLATILQTVRDRGGNRPISPEAVQLQLVEELGQLTPAALGPRGRQRLAAARRRQGTSQDDHAEAQAAIAGQPKKPVKQVPKPPPGIFSIFDDAWDELPQ